MAKVVVASPGLPVKPPPASPSDPSVRASGVYVLKFGSLGMVYCGAGLDVHHRVREQQRQLSAGKSKLRRVQSAWNEDSGASVTIVVRECGEGDVFVLRALEERLIRHWGARIGWHRVLNVSVRPWLMKPPTTDMDLSCPPSPPLAERPVAPVGSQPRSNSEDFPPTGSYK